MIIDTDVLVWYMKGNENTYKSIEQHYLSHSFQLADALIGATAMAYGLHFLTGQ